MPEYAAWTKASAEQWSTLAKSLRDETDIDVAHHQPGGFILCLSEAEMEARINAMRRLHNQPKMVQYPYEILDHNETKRRLPAIGSDVVGSVFCPLDGHVNSLRLFRALHTAMARLKVDYRPNSPVESIKPDHDGFLINGPWGQARVQKLVLAAGLDNARLAPMVGLHAPVRPSKGQVIVTEKAAPFLHHPMVTVRQTDEGGVMIGDSQEDLDFDTVVTPPVISLMAQRAVRMFPLLAGLNVVRTWSALRVMSPDGFPIYDQSQSHHILEGVLPASLEAFSSRRFHVSSAA
jgi:glycine/D-amino acid oxidase-like deaminating enzyme